MGRADSADWTDMKRKSYDDEALVRAIAEGNKSYAQIGREMGLTRQQVWAVARGIYRPELQERIQQARQEVDAARLALARALADRLAGPAVRRLGAMIRGGDGVKLDSQIKAAVDVLKLMFGDPKKARRRRKRRMAPPRQRLRRGGRQKSYEDDALVLALAMDLPHAEIARRFGISRMMVYNIATGRNRPELLGKIEQVRRAYRRRVDELVGELGVAAIKRLAAVFGPGSTASAEHQRRAAAALLDFVFSGVMEEDL